MNDGLDEGWLRRLNERLDQAPARPRAQLTLILADSPGAAVIGSIESTLALQLAGAGLPLRHRGDAWQIEVPGAAGVEPTLAGIARWLHANGLAPAWRGELLDVTDAVGAAIGAIERAAVRPLGIATHAVHLVGSDAHGRVWVQQRAFDKATDPGQWDTTMGGLVAAGESTLQTLERETWEEAGLRIAELRDVAPFGRFTVRRPVANGYMVEHIHMFEATVPNGLVPANQDGEVERFECLDSATLRSRLHEDAFTLEAALITATALQRRGEW